MPEIYLNKRQQNLVRDYIAIAYGLANRHFDYNVHGDMEHARGVALIALCKAAYHYDGRVTFSTIAHNFIKNALTKNFDFIKFRRKKRFELIFTGDVSEYLAEAPPEAPKETPIFSRLKLFLNELEYGILWDVFMIELTHEEILKKYRIKQKQWDSIVAQLLAKVRLVGFEKLTQDEPLDVDPLLESLENIVPVDPKTITQTQKRMWKKT